MKVDSMTNNYPLVGTTPDTRVPPSDVTGVTHKFPGRPRSQPSPVVNDVTALEAPRCYCGVTYALCGDCDNLLTWARNATKPRYVNDSECNHVKGIPPAISTGIVAQPVKGDFLVQIPLATGRDAPNVDVMGPAKPPRCPASLG
jgi:hypothetical protein